MHKTAATSILYLTTFCAAIAFSFARVQPQAASISDRNGGMSRHEAQLPMNPGPVMPPSSQPEDQDVGGDGGLTISDILPKTRSINIFASLTRDISSVSGRLDSADLNTTLLAPLNSAMQELPRKPWEDRPDDDSEVRAANNEDKAAENLKRFVEEHTVPVSPWKAGKEHKVKTLGGQELWWEERNGKKSDTTWRSYRRWCGG